jgi:hypothetical protein
LRADPAAIPCHSLRFLLGSFASDGFLRLGWVLVGGGLVWVVVWGWCPFVF